MDLPVPAIGSNENGASLQVAQQGAKKKFRLAKQLPRGGEEVIQASEEGGELDREPGSPDSTHNKEMTRKVLRYLRMPQ